MNAIAVVRAPNPSVMTLDGTNTYVIDCGAGAIVVDPRPALPAHVDAILRNLQSRNLRLDAIALTHGHPDHAPAAAMLAARTGAHVFAHPNCTVQHDIDFVLESDWSVGTAVLRVIDAPGHTFDHVVLYHIRERALFTGDVILGEGTVVIAPPSGAMRPYQRTLARLRDEFAQAACIYGGHGPPVSDARAKIGEYIAHRRVRERELLEALQARPQTIPQLVLRIYGTGRAALWPAMARQLLAYLIALQEEGRVFAEPLSRAMNAEETNILNPPWESIVGIEHAATIEAELGAMLQLDTLYRYRLTESAS
ncbi:MAG: MBL fold metallo-hydrolase [Candidatus Eremiobacteraeota bacterium]|nr:MBL fold metallo-hydrolase [Candidatus Eremiobacteraeota bacterium]